MKSWFFISLSLVPVFLFGGCDRGIRVVPVTGTVSLDGKPLPLKAIYFSPDRSAGTEGNGAGGYTDVESKYYLIANLGGSTNDKRGVPPGKYRVTVAEPAIPLTADSFKDPSSTIDSDVPAPAVGLTTPSEKRLIPAIYSNPETTPLIVEVPQDGGELNLELTSKPK